MTPVVADTTPLRYLVEIDYESLLLQLFTKVWIPSAVAREFREGERLRSFVNGRGDFPPGSRSGNLPTLYSNAKYRVSMRNRRPA